MKHYQLYNSINTDLAWEKLYSRIQREGLIEHKNGRTTALGLWRTAAAAVALVIFLGTISFFVLRKSGASDAKVYELTASNERNAATLVAVLEDGSIVYLAEDARLDYPASFADDRRMVRLKGKALFEVSGNPKRPFMIETENMTVKVTGTVFEVESASNTLAVQSGEVRATLRKNSQSASIAKGQTATVVAGKFAIAQTVDRERFARYTELLRFKGEKLTNILKVINSRGGDKVLKTTKELEDRQITVTFAGNEPAQDIAGIICNAFDLKLDMDEETITISSKQ